MGKVTEAREHFSKFGIPVRQFEFEAVEPQEDDLQKVALSKIEQAIPHLPAEGDMILVEDAGLFVESLNGFPGVYSSYALSTIGVYGILKLMSHLKSEDIVQDASLRKAEFRAVAILYKDGETFIGEGVCPGRIAHNPTEGHGFGFDPIFIPADLDENGEALEVGEMGHVSTHGTPFGGISLEKKQEFSHRRRAISELLHLIGNLG